MARLVESFVECNSCDYRRKWRDSWPYRLRTAAIYRHKRRTGHDRLTLRQSWNWDSPLPARAEARPTTTTGDSQ